MSRPVNAPSTYWRTTICPGTQAFAGGEGKVAQIQSGDSQGPAAPYKRDPWGASKPWPLGISLSGPEKGTKKRTTIFFDHAFYRVKSLVKSSLSISFGCPRVPA